MRNLISRAALALLSLWLLTAQPQRTFAHSFDPALLGLRERQPGTFDVIWKVPAAPAVTETQLAPAFPDHCALIGVRRSDPADNGGTSFWRVDCGAAGLRGARIRLPGRAEVRLDAVVRITWRDGETTTGIVPGDDEAFVVPAATRAGARAGAPLAAVLISYMRLGILHIWLGFDHLLFVLALLLLVRSRGVLIRTITAFTVAHSLALALAVLDVVRVPPPPVEALIALSIVLLARELARDPAAPPTLTMRYPWAVAFAFGLVHGLGFAGALAEIGLPPDQIPLALFAFNVGVEIGQLAFVLAMLPPLRLFTRLVAKWAWVRWVPTYAIGTVAVAWLIERVERFWVPLT